MKRHQAQAAAATREGRGWSHVEHQAVMLTPPWIASLVLAILGGALHALLGESLLRLAWGVFGLTLATTVVTASAAIIARPRGPITRALAVASTITAGLWLVTATIVGVTNLGLDLAAAGIAATLAVIANLRRLLRAGGDAPATAPGGWDDVADKVRALKAQVRRPEVRGATLSATLELPPGMTAQDVQADAPRIAGLLGTPSSGVRVVEDPDHAGRVGLHITPVDVLRATIRWPGPTLPGRSVAKPIVLGRYEDGADLAVTLPGVPGKRALSHVLVVGMTGAGKSELIQVLVGTLGCRTDVVIDYLDVAGKAEQTVGPIRAAISTLVTTKAEGAAHLRQLLAEVPGRAQVLAAAGMREWQPGAPIPFKVVIIDEGASLVAESDDFVELVRVLRSVGVVLVLALQRATHDQMPTSARANFGTSVCFGVRAAGDATGALSTEVRDAGASPERWKNRKPGYLYLEAPGIPEERCAMPARAYLASPEDVARILGEAAHLRYQPPASAVAIPAPEQTRAAATAVLAEALDEQDHEQDQVPGYAAPPAMVAELGAVDPDAELTTPTGMDMGQRLGPPPRTPPRRSAQAVTALDEFLAGWRQSGPAQWQRRDLIAAGLLDVCGRSPSWVSGELSRRVEAGQLARVGEIEDGVYTWADALALTGHTQ